MKKLSMVLALVLALAMLVPMTSIGSAEEMTDVGTPRAQTLIVEPDGGTYACAGQYNPYMTGTEASWGMHQLMWAEGLWDVNTMQGATLETYAYLPEHNDDYTEWTVKLIEGRKWSDGEAIDANDWYFTFDSIMNIADMSNHDYFNSLFATWEKVDDYTLKFTMQKPFTRLTTTLGVNTWGCSFRCLPEHIYKDVDIMSFEDNTPLAADAFKVKDQDPLGNWILYEKREDWENTTTGAFFPDNYENVPQYVLYRVFGSGESRVMAAINNEVDVMNEVSYEQLTLMLDANDKIRGWYSDFPYANTDDACSKGICFNCAKEPFNDVDVRWALTLACNWVDVSEYVFSGIGRMSALMIPAVYAQYADYYQTLQPWLSNELMVFDGTYNPWDPDFAITLRDALIEDFGYESLTTLSDQETRDMFGSGYWKTDLEKAEEILLSKPQFSKTDDGKWLLNGEPWTIEILCHPEEDSTQAARSSKAIGDQWSKFGIGIEVTTLSGADLGTRHNLGDFDCDDSWPVCSGYVQDFYNNITGWNSNLYHYEIGETGSGVAGTQRLDQSLQPELAVAISEDVEAMEGLDPKSPEMHDAAEKWLKDACVAAVNITVQAGTKIVPVNETYWTNFASNENPVEGPWWWWSCARFIYAQIKPAQ